MKLKNVYTGEKESAYPKKYLRYGYIIAYSIVSQDHPIGYLIIEFYAEKHLYSTPTLGG